MPTPTTSKLPKPRSEDEFEDIALDALKVRWQDPNAQRHGRRGQRQHGVDIFGRPAHLNGELAVAQCKNADVTLQIILTELDKLTGFGDSFDEFLVVTSMSRDANLQAEVRRHFALAGSSFRVEVIFWEDLVLDLATEPALIAKHWKGFAGSEQQRTLPAPRFQDRGGIPDEQTLEWHLEIALMLRDSVDLDIVELFPTIEAILPRPGAPVLNAMGRKGPLRSGPDGYSWSVVGHPFSNVSHRMELEILPGPFLALRCAGYSKQDFVTIHSSVLIDYPAMALWLFTCAFRAAIGGAAVLGGVAARVAMDATGEPTLIDDEALAQGAPLLFVPKAARVWAAQADLADATADEAVQACLLARRSLGQFSGVAFVGSQKVVIPDPDKASSRIRHWRRIVAPES